MFRFISRSEDITQCKGISAVVRTLFSVQFIKMSEDSTRCAGLSAIVRTLLSVQVYLQ